MLAFSPLHRPVRAALLLTLALGLALAPPGRTQTGRKTPRSSDTVKASMEAFWDADYPTAEKLARSVTADPGARKEDLVEAQKCLACVFVMQQAQRAALESLIRMFQLDPGARFSPDANYPPPVIRTYYTVRDSLFAGTMDLKTVAVGDFENNSVYTGKFKNYDFGALAKALPHLITLDLTGATTLKVVDRQRVADILKEMALSTSGFADPGQAVQAGKLLGAHAYIFGQYMLLSADKVRIDARVVRTATGEVVVARQITGTFSGKPEVFLQLEKQLVTELMKTLDQTLGAGLIENPTGVANAWFDRKAREVAGRPGYVDGVFLTAQALQAEEQQDYKGAIENWKKVLAADPGNDVAAVRIKVLQQTVAQG